MRFHQWKRREFITLLGDVPLTRAEDDPDVPVRVAAFAQELQELGWTVGGNVRIDYRWVMTDWLRSRRTSSWPRRARA